MAKITLKQISTFKYGTPVAGGYDEQQGGNFAVIVPKHIRTDDNCKIDFKSIKKVKVDAKKVKKLICGDLLFSAKGTLKCALFDCGDDFFIASASFIIISPSENVYPLYLKEYLNSEMMKRKYRSITDGSTIPSISIKELDNLEIHLPSYEKQVKIANMMTDYTKCEQLLEEKIKLLKMQKDQIFRSLTSGQIDFLGDNND